MLRAIVSVQASRTDRQIHLRQAHDKDGDAYEDDQVEPPKPLAMACNSVPLARSRRNNISIVVVRPDLVLLNDGAALTLSHHVLVRHVVDIFSKRV